MHIRRGLAVVFVAIAMAACGDDDSADETDGAEIDADTDAPSTAATTAPSTSSDAPSTSTPATSAPTTAPAATEPGTTAVATTATETSAAPSTPAPDSEAGLAASALLTLDDMPSGWLSSSNTDDDEADEDMVQQIADCGGLDPTLIGDAVLGNTEAESDEFEDPEGAAAVSQSIGFTSDEATAIAAITEIRKPALAGCYEEAIRSSFAEMASGSDPSNTLPSGMTLTAITMEPVDLTGVAEPDEAMWYRATAEFDFNGQPLPLYIELLFLREGRVLSQLELQGNGEPFPEDLIDPIVTRAQEKMAEIATA